MPQYTSILRSLTPEKFAEILGASARQARETYFHRHDIRAPKTRGLPKAGAKNEYRVAQLLAAIKAQDDEEMSEQLLRSWLLTKRSILGAALDHLGIAHKDGLTESDDVAQIEKLSPQQLGPLAKAICAVGSKEDALVYLQFMGAQNAAQAVENC